MARKCYQITVIEGNNRNHFTRKAHNHAEALRIGERLSCSATVEAKEITQEEYDSERATTLVRACKLKDVPKV